MTTTYAHDTRGLWMECPNHGGAFDCNPFCRVCEGEQEVPVTDLETALDNPPAYCEGVARLYIWGDNEIEPTYWFFLDLTGISSDMGAWYQSQMRPLGALECDLLGRALREFADRPNDVRAYVQALADLRAAA